MRVLLVNSVFGVGSTGKICAGIVQEMKAQGHEVKVAYGRNTSVTERYRNMVVRIGNNFDVSLHGLRSILLDEHGLGSKSATKHFIAWANTFNPDLLWLHNIHGYYINYEKLFNWIKTRPNMEVYWTLHDCWAFTGHCPHFSAICCSKWLKLCNCCPQKRRYPISLLCDRSEKNFLQKKKLFTNVSKLTIIVPSMWLKNLVEKSYLGKYPIKVIPNKVDKSVFQPIDSDFKKKYKIESKFVILGVANVWDKYKGWDLFIELAKKLDERFQIVLVGLSKINYLFLPKNIIGIKNTHSAEVLASIYSGADVFLNLSKEETFGMTTLEAISCGTKAIIIKGTAGEEFINNSNGFLVEPNIDSVLKIIYKEYEKKTHIGEQYA